MFSNNVQSTYSKVHTCLNPPKKLLIWFSTFGERTYTQMRISIVLLIRWTDSSLGFRKDPIQRHYQDHAMKNLGLTGWKLRLYLSQFKTQTAVSSLQVAWPNNSLCLPLLLFLWPLSFPCAAGYDACQTQVNSLSQMNPEKQQHFLRDNELYQLSVIADD